MNYQRRALIVVDVQKDFVEGGALGVAGGKAVATAIDELAPDYEVLVATRDWHDPGSDNGGHFVPRQVRSTRRTVITGAGLHHVGATEGGQEYRTERGSTVIVAGPRLVEPDFVNTWPDHCVAGTPGAEYADELSYVPAHAVAIKKGQGKPAYSGFEGETDMGRSLEDVLREADVTDVDIVGIATDYCVRATALDAVALGYRVRVFSDLVAAVAQDSGQSAIEEMRDAGVTVTTSTEARDA